MQLENVGFVEMNALSASNNVISQALSHAKWSSVTESKPQTCSPLLWNWLSERGSMSERLRLQCQKHFTVRVLFQGWGIPLTSELAFLAQPKGVEALIREVELLVDNEVWVYGRSVFPRAIVEVSEKALLTLGDKPLGQFLFFHPAMSREYMECALLASERGYFQPQSVWARRSKFTLHDSPLLVSEIFMTDKIATKPVYADLKTKVG